MPRVADAEAQLLAAGAPFEIGRETVFGVPLEVFVRRQRSLRDILAASLDFGDAEYIVFEDRRISFREHADVVAAWAAALAARYGVRPGDRVAILGANRPEWIISFWATVALGAIAVALNGWWTRDEISYALEDCEPSVLVGDRKRLDRTAGVVASIPVVEMESELERLAREHQGAPLPRNPIREDEPACIMYTSGTTGRPKGAVHTHRNIIALSGLQLFHGMRLLLASGEPPRNPPCALITNPLFHVSGLYTGAVTMLASGVKTVWMDGRFDPLRVLECIERERVTSWSPMGTMAYRVVHHPRVGDFDLSTVTNIGSGGAPMGTELQANLRRVFPNAAATFGLGYGLTEATALATINFGEELERYPDSVGRPLPTVALDIRDEHGEPVPSGEEGEIYIRSPLVMHSYWRRPRETADALRDGRWLRTGDWGRLEDGRLYVNARKRDLILRGAENIYPAEIELRLEAHPDVVEAAVLGVAHEELGQEVKAVVVLRPAARRDPDALGAWVREALAYYKVPAHWEFRDRPLPRNAAGKVVKSLLEPDVMMASTDEA